jgi:predicted DNA-binding antitoxin AbrB/MazE fold protein
MSKVLQATYHDGNLILDKKLDVALEGKKLTLILIEDSESSEQADRSMVDDAERKRRFLEFLEKSKQYSAQLPPGYKFDREEAHER